MTKGFEVTGPAPVMRFSVMINTADGDRVTEGGEQFVEFRFKNPATLGGRPIVAVWNETAGAQVTGHVTMPGDDIVIRVRADVAAETPSFAVTVIG
ncbi:hypothetical protein [Actinoplanes campanulatus]|nr:hypothetical protein [Actinoplanes capillaceus]